MAFNRENLSVTNNSIKSGVVPKKWFYYNEDGDTMTTAGALVDKRLIVGDIVEELKADFTVLTFYRVSAVSDGSATLVLLTALSPDADT